MKFRGNKTTKLDLPFKIFYDWLKKAAGEKSRLEKMGIEVVIA